MKKFRKFVKKWNAYELNDIFYDEKELLCKYGDEIGHFDWSVRDDEAKHKKLQEDMKKQVIRDMQRNFKAPSVE